MTDRAVELERLRAQRAELADRLQDAVDEKAFIIGQSRVHLSRSEWLRYDREAERYGEQIAEVDAKIAELEGG